MNEPELGPQHNLLSQINLSPIKTRPGKTANLREIVPLDSLMVDQPACTDSGIAMEHYKFVR
jgi:hypothetical protein